jgi:hypothetical protein
MVCSFLSLFPSPFRNRPPYRFQIKWWGTPSSMFIPLLPIMDLYNLLLLKFVYRFPAYFCSFLQNQRVYLRVGLNQFPSFIKLIQYGHSLKFINPNITGVDVGGGRVWNHKFIALSVSCILIAALIPAITSGVKHISKYFIIAWCYIL